MSDNDGFAMEEIRDRHSNSFSSHKSSPGSKRAPPPSEMNNAWPENGGEKSTSINISGSGSNSVKRGTSNSPDVVYTWSGLTIKTKQGSRTIKDAIVRREPPKPKTILRDGE